MRGRKPDLSNVVPLPLHDDPQAIHIDLAKRLRPDWLSTGELKSWDRIAPQMAMLGRLKPHFVDALAEYCIIRDRLFEARKKLDDLEWTYVVTGRNGTQYKSRPEIAQLNDDWRKWRSLVGEFGLAPSAERALSSNQLDIFDDFDNF